MAPDILFNVIAGAACGTAGAVIGHLIARKLRLGRIPTALVAVVCIASAIVAGTVAINRFVAGPRQNAEIEAALRSTPLLIAISENYPESREKLRTVMQQFYAEEVTQPQMLAVMNGEISRLREQATPRANETNTVAMLAISRNQIAMIRDRSVPECESFVLDGSTQAPIADLLGPQMVQREQALLSVVLRQAATEPATWPDTVSETDIDRFIDEATEDVLGRLPEAERAAAIARLESGQPALACERTIAMLDLFMGEPPARAAALFQRYSTLNTATGQ